jgi:hypothetical protein
MDGWKIYVSQKLPVEAWLFVLTSLETWLYRKSSKTGTLYVEAVAVYSERAVHLTSRTTMLLVKCK